MPSFRRKFRQFATLWLAALVLWSPSQSFGQPLTLADPTFLFSSANGAAAVTADWVARSVANGGTTPTSAQQTAVTAFVAGCMADGIWTDIYWCDIFCPTASNVKTTLTPLVTGSGGNDPRTTNVNLDSQANDLKGLHGVPASNVAIFTGLMTSAVWSSDDDAGLSMIVPDFNGLVNAAGIELGAYGPDSVKSVGIAANSSGNSSSWMWDGAHSVVVATLGTGFYATDRTAANNLKLYFGKTGTPLAQVGATQTAPGGSRWSSAGFDIRILALEFGGGSISPSSSYVCFVCGHKGWDAVKEALIQGRANTLRIAFGGGNV